MTRVEKSIEIKTSPEKVWPLIMWERIPEWFDIFKKVEWTSKDKNKVGSTVHFNTEVAGVKAEMDAEIIEVVENEKGSWRSTGGNIKASGSITLTSIKDGTKVTILGEYELPYSVLGKVIDKLRVHKAYEKSFETSLKKLKDILEK